MVVDLYKLTPPPLLFGQCRQCPYMRSGSSMICYSCAARAIDLVGAGRCRVCDQRVPAGEECSNPWCHDHMGPRYFEMNFSIAMLSGRLRNVIYNYKLDGVKGWATILGRVLAGYLDSHYEDFFGDYNLIVGSPTFMGAGSRHQWDHIGELLAVAAQEVLPRWNFDDLDDPTIIKTVETPEMKSKKWAEQRKIAEGPLRSALYVPHPERIQGKDVLVFDDIFTNGMTLREVARALLDVGASTVSQVSLARQPLPARLRSQPP